MDAVLHDFRYAARSLRRARGFTAVAVLTLATGMGVLTASFAVVRAVLLHPYVPDQERVVRIWKDDVERGEFRHALTYEEYRSFRERSRTLDSVAAIQTSDASTLVFTINDQPLAAGVLPVSADFFHVVRARPPIHGRAIQTSDEARGAELVGVVSEAFWRRVAGSDPAFVGRRLEFAAGSAAGIAGGARTMLVVGVASADLDFPVGTDVWVPIASFFDGAAGRFDFDHRRFAQFELLARLRPGASTDETRAELDVLDRVLRTEFPDAYLPMRFVVQPLVDSIVGNARQVLTFLMAAAALVLAIAGVNVAALLLMRSASRRRERAVRLALGASRKRLARYAFAETLLLGTTAGVLGAVLAFLLLRLTQSLAPADVPRLEHAAIDVRALMFCAAAILVWVVTLGGMPSWAHRDDDALRAGDLVSRSRPRSTGLRLFTVTQVAAAVVVAIGAVLLVRSFVQLGRIDRGFDPENLAVISVLLPDGRYPDAPRRVAFYQELLPDIEAIPGVLAASPVHMNPGSGPAGLSAPMWFEGQTEEEGAKNPWASWDPVMPSYFRTFGVRILEGRPLSESDAAQAAPVAVVSESVARRYWPAQRAIGKRLRLASEFPWVTVVGVARDLRYRELTKDWMTVYFPAPQFFFFSPTKLVVRAAGNAEPLIPVIGERIRAREPAAAITKVERMETLLSQELSRPRIALAVTGLFAVVAILLAAVGTYGVMSYEVTERRYELAVRSALGATPARLVRAVVRESATLGALGATAGVVIAALVTRMLASLLFEVSPADPRAFAIGALALVSIVVLAAAVPARRAAATDPASVLRTE